MSAPVSYSPSHLKSPFVTELFDTPSYAVPYGPQFAKASTYLEPLRAKIEIWDLKKTELRYSYDSFAGKAKNQIFITGLDVSLGVDQHGSFTFRIWDSDRYIEPKYLKRKNIVVVAAKKYYNEDWQNIIYGYTNGVEPIRENTNMLEYEVSGVGSGSVLNERIVNYARVAPPESLTSANPLRGNVQMQANNVFKDLVTNPSVYAADDRTIAEQLNIDVSLLDSSPVRDVLGGIVQRYTPAAVVFNAILEGVGATGGVNANNQFFLNYPNTKHSGITIKSWDWQNDDLNTDLAQYTSYMMGPFRYTMSWKKEDGFCNKWVSKGKVSNLLATSTAVTTTGDTETENKVIEIALDDMDLAQEFQPRASSFRDLALMLRRTGNGTSDPVRVKTLYGQVRLGNYGWPTGATVAYFTYPLKDIPTDAAAPCYITDLRFLTNIDPSWYLWIVLFYRGHTTDDTIYWSAVQDYKGSNATRATGYSNMPWAYNPDLPSGWEIHTNAYTFMYSAFDSYTHAIVAEDSESQELFGIVEDSADIAWAPTTDIVNKFITERLYYTAMPKIIYNANTVTIPGQLFLPGQVVSIQDAMSDLPPNRAVTADLLEVHYSFGATTNAVSKGSNLGCMFVDVSPLGVYDFREEAEAEEDEDIDDP